VATPISSTNIKIEVQLTAIPISQWGLPVAGWIGYEPECVEDVLFVS